MELKRGRWQVRSVPQNRTQAPQDTTCRGFRNLPDHLVGAAEQRDRKCLRRCGALIQSDHAVQLAVGDVALFDAARPAACFANNAQWLGLQLPRQSLISHLGCELQGGLYARGGTPAVRLLFDLVREAEKGSGSSPADSYMQLAVYDLLGALFAPSDPSPVSRHADKLFARIRGVVKDGFADHRRASLGISQPLSEIAYACGFRDYTHFARKFRQRFGYSPGAAARDTVALATL
jgi:AraC family transcriptional regulator, positive regulator of tynA and feaB